MLANFAYTYHYTFNNNKYTLTINWATDVNVHRKKKTFNKIAAWEKLILLYI